VTSLFGEVVSLKKLKTELME